jgi:uncharacterized protein (TIGR03083 family)
MEVEAHVAQLRHDGSTLAGAIAEAGPDAKVPACPDWVVRDLVHHLGRVHRWATAFVVHGYTRPGDVEFESVGGPLPDDEDLVNWYVDGHGELVDALAGAPADLECWSFLAAPSPLAFWARRQSHETAMHRVDAEQAAGRVLASCPSAFAADGLDELLTGFVPRLRIRADEEPPPTSTIRVACTDDTAQWLVTTGPERATVVRGSDERGHESTTDWAPDGTARGRAEDLYLALWKRRDSSTLLIEGDAGVVGSFLELVRI